MNLETLLWGQESNKIFYFGKCYIPKLSVAMCIMGKSYFIPLILYNAGEDLGIKESPRPTASEYAGDTAGGNFVIPDQT